MMTFCTYPEGPPAGADWTDGADLVVNATASPSVRALLDLRRSNSAAVPILTVGVDGRAERVFARLLPAPAGAGVADLEREVKLALADRPDAAHFADAFFPAADGAESSPFYPEPGCSESTFVGSAADLGGLAAIALNWATARLAGPPNDAPVALLAAPPHVTVGSGLLPHVEVSASPRVSLSDPRSGYLVKLTPEAVEDIERAVDDSHSRLGPGVETGGPVYGAWDALRRTVWVDRVGSPPPDSVEAQDRFVCGFEGLADETDRLDASTRGATGFVGTWHTHPLDPPDPSGRDLASLADVFSRPERLPRVFTMLIAGASSEGPVLKAHVFHRAEFVATADS
ncbi:Mov34/MPN/PAD-1 family protein [Rubrivirga sp. S365]|nr:Mov34/MPN/PAD-1 family protein [Rubrivirga sp. S365]